MRPGGLVLVQVRMVLEALAFLATPTDVFAVPGDAVAHSVLAYEGRSRLGKPPCTRP